MNYHFNLTLKKTGSSEWTVYSEKGHSMCVFARCVDKFDAEMQAKAWASTWSSVNIRVIDEQDKPRDKVSRKT